MAAHKTHTGQVTNAPNPIVRMPITPDTIIITTAPQIVEYNIPNGPKRIVKRIAMPTLFVGVTMTLAGSPFTIASPPLET
jgi:hypothetical protein